MGFLRNISRGRGRRGENEMKDGRSGKRGSPKGKAGRNEVAPLDADADADADNSQYRQPPTDAQSRKSREERSHFSAADDDRGEKHFFKDTVEVHETSNAMNDANTVLSDSFETEVEPLKIDNKDLKKRHDLACKHLKDGEFRQSLAVFEEILSMLLQKHGLVHQRVGGGLHNVGIVKLLSGNLNDALDVMEEAVSIRKRTLGAQHPKVTDSLIELGIILLARKEYGDALEIFYEALDMREEEMDSEDANTVDMEANNLSAAKILNNIACVHTERGELDEARKKLEAAVDLQQATLEDVHPSRVSGFLAMVSTMQNLGSIYITQSNFPAATKIFSKALEIQKRTLEDGNKHVQMTLENLAYSFAMNGEYEDSIKVYERLLQGHQPDTIEYAEMMTKIVYCQVHNRQFEQAKENLMVVEKIQERMYGPTSKQLSVTRKCIGEINYQMLKFPNPMETVMRSLSITCCGGQNVDGGEGFVDSLSLPKPLHKCKMSGHKITHA